MSNADKKYELDRRYRLRVRDAEFDDQGGYECSMGAYSYPVYLSISGRSLTTLINLLDVKFYFIYFVPEPPQTTDIYWNDYETWTWMYRESNLTCYASSSYPPATFQWFRGSTELTHDAVYEVEDRGSGEHVPLSLF